MSIEQTILSNLVYNEAYGRKVIPFLKDEYFSDVPIRTVYQLIDAYVKQYNAFPSKEALAIDLSNRVGTPENVFKSSKDIVESLSFDKDTQVEWLVTQTEKFCQEKAVYNAIMSSIKAIKLINTSDSLQISYRLHHYFIHNVGCNVGVFRKHYFQHSVIHFKRMTSTMNHKSFDRRKLWGSQDNIYLVFNSISAGHPCRFPSVNVGIVHSSKI